MPREVEELQSLAVLHREGIHAEENQVGLWDTQVEAFLGSLEVDAHLARLVAFEAPANLAWHHTPLEDSAAQHCQGT